MSVSTPTHLQQTAFAGAISAPAVTLLLLVSIQAVWAASFPTPLVWDFLNHAARLEVLTSPTDSPLRNDYKIVWGLIPNLGLDLIGTSLAPLLSAEASARLVWFIGLLGAPLATWLLQRQLHAASQASLPIAAALMFNIATTAGLMNYALGITAGLLSLALWLRWRDRLGLVQLIALNLISIGLFVLHIAALAAVVGMIGLIELFDRISRRSVWRATRVLGFFAAGLALTAASAPVDPFFQLKSAKFMTLWGPVFSGQVLMDLVRGGAVLGVIAVLFHRGRLQMHRLLAAPLVIFVGLIVVAPSALGATSLLDARLAVFAAFVAVAGLAVDRKALGIVGIVVATVIAGQLFTLTPAWHRHQSDRAALHDLAKGVPAGARVVVARARQSTEGNACAAARAPGSLDHMAAALVIERGAFVHLLFNGEGMQPVRVASQLRLPWVPRDIEELMAPASSAGKAWEPALSRWRSNYNYVLLINPRCLEAPPAGLQEIGRTEAFGLFAVKPDLSPDGQTR